MHKIIFPEKIKKKYVCLPYLKFSDLLPETHLYFLFGLMVKVLEKWLVFYHICLWMHFKPQNSAVRAISARLCCYFISGWLHVVKHFVWHKTYYGPFHLIPDLFSFSWNVTLKQDICYFVSLCHWHNDTQFDIIGPVSVNLWLFSYPSI